MNVALVGAGFAGGIHAQAWAEVDNARVVLVVDPEPARARTLARRCRAPWETSPEAALARTDVEVVDVCAPTALHAELTVQAALAGKHVLCEKPIALDLDEADRAIVACAEAEVILMVGHVLRFWPEYRFLETLVRGRALGSVRAISCSRLVKTPDWTAGGWLLDPAQSRGVPGEVMIHDLDVVAHILGRPRAVTATGLRDAGGWAHVQALMRHDSASAVVEAGWDAPPAQPFAAGFRAVFEEGILEYDSRRSPTLTAAGAELALPSAGPGQTDGGPWRFDATAYLEEIRYFAACVRRREPPERCPPAAAREALELALAVVESVSSGKEVSLG